MILITSAKYCPPEFSIEFGKLVPSFLPLANKRLYEYQIALFKAHALYKNEKIVLSLPQSFKPEKADLKKLESLGAQLLFAPDGLSLGESINYCLCMNLPLKNLQILHADTYISRLDEGKNVLGASKVSNNYEWSFLTQSKKLHYKLKNSAVKSLDKLILNGYFKIEKPYIFMRHLSACEYDFVKALYAYSQDFAFDLSVDETWLDFGLVSSYFQSKKTITTQRAFNSLQIKDNFVLKKSRLKDKIEAEIAWFKAFPEELSFYIPKFSLLDSKSYKTEYLYLNTLSELFVFGYLPPLIWDKIFHKLKDFLNKLHAHKLKGKKPDFNYKAKSLERLQAFSRQHKFKLDKPLSLEFKGRVHALPSLLEMLEILDRNLPPKQEFCFIHGDFCFSNIMFDFRANELKCFDPRGLDFKGTITPFGDKNYDLAKLAHSIIGLYDFFIAGFFELEFKDYHFKLTLDLKDKAAFEASFLRIFKLSESQIYALIIHLFLSMLPLHSDNEKRQFGLLANALRLFVRLIELEKESGR